jgi:hypothetical protein
MLTTPYNARFQLQALDENNRGSVFNDWRFLEADILRSGAAKAGFSSRRLRPQYSPQLFYNDLLPKRRREKASKASHSG